MMALEFARPEFLYLLLVLPVWWLVVWPRAGRGVVHARGESARGLGSLWGLKPAVVLVLPRALRAGAMACLILALAAPQRVEVVQDVALRGKGISIVLDLSTSMLATDMEGGSSRLDVARDAAIRFAQRRPHDELSLVAFAGEAVTRVPPTRDPNLVVSGVGSLRTQLLRDGTDIAGAVLTSTARLMESETEPRVVVLLTDGAHNGVNVPPLAAARAAEAQGIRVHSIAFLGQLDASSAHPAVQAAMLQRRAALEADMETVLSGIATLTGGEYFHASSGAALDSIYAEIDRIETPVEEVTDREIAHPQRAWLLFLGLVLLGSDVLLRGSRWGVVP